jgi:hypothetical protein
MLPGVRAIAIVRPPAERAFSHFAYTWNGPAADVVAGFEAAVATELPLADSPFAPGEHNLRLGRYAAQLSRWTQAVGPDHLLVLDYREVTGSAAVTMQRVSSFLGVDREFSYNVETKYNPSTSSDSASLSGRIDKLVKPAFPYIKRALPASVTGRLARRRAQVRAAARGSVPALPESILATLTDYYAHDVAYVREHFSIDLAG